MKENSKQIVFLISGFGEFQGVKENPTEKFIQSLSEQEKTDNEIAVADILEVSIEGADIFVSKINEIVESHLSIDSKRPIVIINFGVSSYRTLFTLEQIGYNKKQFNFPDVKGNMFQQEKICQDFDLDLPLKTKIDLKSIGQKINQTCGKQLFQVGADPGRYLCNYVYFQSLSKLQTKGANVYSLFVHCPPFGQIEQNVQKEQLLNLLNLIKEDLLGLKPVTMNKCLLVRESCARVMRNAEHVKISEEKLEQFASTLKEEFDNGYKYVEFGDYDCHYQQFENEEAIIDYIFILDTLNFCFWPSTVEFEYDDLAAGLKKMAASDPSLLKPKNLINFNREFLKENVFKGLEFPLLDERVRLLREIGLRTLEYFDGEFINVIKKANHSAVKLLDLLTSFYNNFQDIAIYEGQQICLYKRSQIMIGDIYGAFKGKGLGYFSDISEVTTFPDYRVPQILRHYGVLEYSKVLSDIIDSHTLMPHGGQMEVEIRAGTVEAVEELKKQLEKRGKSLHSIEVDWILWQKGEEARKEIKAHHRVLSIFY